jgi:dihydrofolate synthase / folylpolyglutamate synthase
VLRAAGYRTGLFTSPHLERVEDRIVVDGQSCSEADMAELVGIVRPAAESLDEEAITKDPPEQGPTYFEILTAMAFCQFARRGVNAAVLEVGLGGRLDSTNVCTPSVSIITSISLDHVKQLGDTLAAIAAEKAGFIKPGVPVISGVTNPEPRDVVRGVAPRNGCWLVELGVDFDFEYHPPRHLEQSPSLSRLKFHFSSVPTASDSRVANSRGLTAPGMCSASDEIELSLLGRHRAANAALVLAAIEELRRVGWTIPEAAVRRGLAEVRWPARVEVIGRRPTVILDAAHNAASIEALVEVIGESFSARKRLLIFATTQEKDLCGMLERLLGRFDHIIFTRYQENPRSVPPEELLALARTIVGWGSSSTATPTTASCTARATFEIAPTPADAWDVVHRLADPDDLICITGSFFLAAEMHRQVIARPFPRA